MMKAMLLIFLINNANAAGVRIIEIPIKDYDYCLYIANQKGEYIARLLGDTVYEVLTDCVNQTGEY